MQQKMAESEAAWRKSVKEKESPMAELTTEKGKHHLEHTYNVHVLWFDFHLITSKVAITSILSSVYFRQLQLKLNQLVRKSTLNCSNFVQTVEF